MKLTPSPNVLGLRVFGPLFKRVKDEGPPDLTVTYGSEGQARYTATGCSITWVDELENFITCDTVAGVGSGLFWRVTINGDESFLSLNGTNYDFPSITGVGGDHASIPTKVFVSWLVG